MKQKWIKRAVMFIMISCLLVGCAEDKESEETTKSVKSVMTVNDFKITLSTEKAEYTSEELEGKEAPFAYRLELEYVGEEESVKLWHGGSIGIISLLNPEGEYIIWGVIDSIGKYSVLEKDTALTIAEWDGRPEIEEIKEMKPGVYMVKAGVNFYVGEDFKDKEHLETVEGSFCVPLVIR